MTVLAAAGVSLNFTQTIKIKIVRNTYRQVYQQGCGVAMETVGLLLKRVDVAGVEGIAERTELWVDLL